MKLILQISLMLSMMTFVSLSYGKSKSKKSRSQSERTTDARFNGTTVHGRYAHSPEAVVTVENDKKLISVVKPRKSFMIQIKKSQEELK